MFKSKEVEELKATIAKLEAQVKASDVDDRIKALETEREETRRRHLDQLELTQAENKRLKAVEVTLQKQFDDQKALAYKTMELEFKGKQMEEIQKIRTEYDAKLMKATEENYEKLSKALAKLHEEGNAQTKFTEQIALKMMDSIKTSGVPQLENKNG